MKALYERLVFFTLMCGLGTSFLAVWIFSKLRQGLAIVPDKMNEIEFYIAAGIFTITVAAVISHLIVLIKK